MTEKKDLWVRVADADSREGGLGEEVRQLATELEDLKSGVTGFSNQYVKRLKVELETSEGRLQNRADDLEDRTRELADTDKEVRRLEHDRQRLLRGFSMIADVMDLAVDDLDDE